MKTLKSFSEIPAIAPPDEIDVDDLVSECCSAPLLGSYEDPICSECKEHAEAAPQEEDEYPMPRGYNED